MTDRSEPVDAADREDSVRASEPRRADLGVLLVHGIGQSRSSDTLTRFGEPLVAWISEWIGGAATVKVTDAVLGVEAQDPSVRPHTRLRITAPGPDGGTAVESEWLIAESWWAESFASPSFRDLVDWGLRIVPLTLFFHFSRRSDRARTAMQAALRQRPRRYRLIAGRISRWLLDLVTLLVALLLAPLLMALLLLMLIGGLLPIPRLRSLIGSLQRRLAVTVGDSYSLLGPKIGAAAIYGRVERDLDWLAQQVEQTAVVAHSQGAAIAYRVVSRRASNPCRLLVTFGAGIRKLGQIRRIKAGSAGWIGWVTLSLVLLIFSVHLARAHLGLPGGLLLSAGVPVAWLSCSALLGLILNPILRWRARRRDRPVRGLSDRATMILGMVSAVVAMVPAIFLLPGKSIGGNALLAFLNFIAWAWVFGAMQKAGEDSQGLTMSLPDEARATPPGEKPLPDETHWLDLFASHDPVPNGPIFDGIDIDRLTGEGTSHGIRSVETINRASPLTDHTAYWTNSEEFTPVVAAALGAACDLNFAEVRPFDSLRLTVARHRRAWRNRWLRRSRYVAFACGTAIWFSGRAHALGASLVAGLLDLIERLPILGPILKPILPDGSAPEPVNAAIAATLVALGVWLATSVGWGRWDLRDLEALVERRGYGVAKGSVHPAVGFHVTWLACATVTGLFVAGVGLWPWWIYPLVLFGLLLIAGGIIGVDPFQGPLQAVWEKLLRRLGETRERANEDWRQRVYERRLALIDEAPDTPGSWHAATTFEYRGAETLVEQREAFDSREAAIAWGRERAARVLVASEGFYVAAESLPEDSPPATGAHP